MAGSERSEVATKVPNLLERWRAQERRWHELYAEEWGCDVYYGMYPDTMAALEHAEEVRLAAIAVVKAIRSESAGAHWKQSRLERLARLVGFPDGR
jgi:hypothetical protein